MKILSGLLLLMFLRCDKGLAAIYVWQDESGESHFSDRPPVNAEAQEITVQPIPQQAPGHGQGLPGRRFGERQLIEDRAQKRKEKAQQPAQPRDVFGSIILDFRIINGAQLPTSAMKLTLNFEPKSGSGVIRHEIKGPQRDWVEWRNRSPGNSRALLTLNFTVPLVPGDYRLQSLEVVSNALLTHRFRLPLNARFRVPTDVCVYVGRRLFTYIRLPSGTRTQQKMDAAAVERKFGRVFDTVYLKKGGLVLTRRRIDATPTENKTRSLIKKSWDPYLEATIRGCIVRPAGF